MKRVVALFALLIVGQCLLFLRSHFSSGEPLGGWVAKRSTESRGDWNSSQLPTVLILTPMKDIKPRTLTRYIKNLQVFEYPRHLISIGILEGDSTDDSFVRIAKELPELRKTFRRVSLFHMDFQPKDTYHLEQGTELRHDITFQKGRRSILAKSRNFLLSKALRDEQWVLWMDADVGGALLAARSARCRLSCLAACQSSPPVAARGTKTHIADVPPRCGLSRRT